MERISRYRKEILIFLILIVLYFILRLPNLTLQPIFADEAIYIRWAQVMRAEPTLRFLPLSDGKTPFFMWAMMPILKFIEDPLFAGRFLSVMSGFATLLGVFILTWKVFNLRAALWAALIYTVVPYTVFFDRMALVDSMLSAFTVWALYFATWLARALRLDLAMSLGYLLGGALLVKTSALVNLLVLPTTLVGLRKNNLGKYPILKYSLLLAVSILIALAMYNLLRLGPNFQLLSSRNADYVFSPWELKGRMLDPFIPHFHDISDWFPKLLTLPILILIGLGIYYVIVKFNRLGLIILAWAMIPLLIEMAFLKTFTARYLLPSIPFLIILGGYGISKVLEKIRLSNLVKILIALLAILPLALNFDYQLITNPPPNSLPMEERKGYFEDWTAGYGFKEIAQFLTEIAKHQSVVLGTEGFFGTLPDGLYIYLDKSNISVVGSTATISAQIRNAVSDHLTFFVGNKSNLEGSITGAKLIKEYPKAKPQSGGPQDATLLYQVLEK